MKLHKALFVPGLFVAMLFTGSAQAATPVSFDNPLIEIIGAKQIKKNVDHLEILRFSDSILSQSQTKAYYNAVKARTTSCAIVKFTTKSPKVKVILVEKPETQRGIDIGVYQDGAYDTCFHFDKAPADFSITVSSKNPGKAVTYEIVLPSWANSGFKGLELDDSATLEANPKVENQITYASIGDSITHGTGQQSKSFLTYPWNLARANGWKLYNLGIGGSTTTPEMGNELNDINADVVTILWGYNDAGNKQFTLQDFKTRYDKLIDNIRKCRPEAKIFCITPIFTENIIREGKSLLDYRKAVTDIVAAKAAAGDKAIYVIKGEEITAKEDLVDGIHLNPDGAKRFAEKLNLQIKPIVGSGVVHPPVPGANLILNPGFEEDVSNWTGNGCAIAKEIFDVHEGEAIAVVSDRTKLWNSLRQDVKESILMNGQGEYSMSAWVRCANGPEKLKIQLVVSDDAGTRYLGATSIADQTWKEFSCIRNLAWTGTLKSAYFEVRTLETLQDYFVDSCTLSVE
ncbi:MAG TPA: hypothetical protein DCZ94_21300 [Lentisphaeria bacterium]|nr:MAG: hypothetical protein A2X48_01050 [Lentisphaerae bacterium GWF2_49_21]HBC89482.1 hypothetical protein [Lentisphaeria bacterium]